MDHAQCTEVLLRSRAGWHTREADRCTGFPKQDHLGGWSFGLLRYQQERDVHGRELFVARDGSVHCSSNVGAHGDTALLFGLSGTGKTTLSEDPDRQLIGDDEHAGTHDGISNLEAGFYAKLINLNKRADPVIAAALSMSDVFIENVAALPDKSIEETDPQDLDLDDNSITENTRISYPHHENPDVLDGEVGPHPNTIVLLSADAFGVLPPNSILSSKEVMYHFVSGFTSKLAGTEFGIIEPIPSSALFSVLHSCRTR